MSAEWATATAGLLTFLVIAASAIAALVQLRHMRSGNQIAALTEIRETHESADFQAATHFVMEEFQRLYQDPLQRARMMERSLPAEFHRVRIVANFYESMGAFVRYGLIDEAMTCDVWGFVVLRNWTALAPFIQNRRRRMDNPGLFENFEYLAALSKRWEQRHGRGRYPKGVDRMPSVDEWVEANPD